MTEERCSQLLDELYAAASTNALNAQNCAEADEREMAARTTGQLIAGIRSLEDFRRTAHDA